MTSDQITKLIAEIRASNLSYCGPPKLENIAEAALRVSNEGIRGIFIEAGVALGGSAILLGRMMPPTTKLHLYDVFSMIPPPSLNDGSDAHTRYDEIKNGVSTGLGGDKYYGYVENLESTVKQNLKRFNVNPEGENVSFHKGLFSDTLKPDGPIALAHVDCDWYDSVTDCIQRIGPHLSPGGIIIFDDYSSYSGCRRAVDEWLISDPQIEKIFLRRSIGLRRKSS